MGAPLHLSTVAECYCGVTEAIPSQAGLPAGWRNDDGRVQCPDCAKPSDEPALIPAEGAVRGDHGCRILASAIGNDAVVLSVHVGARPIAGEIDKPLHFVARDADLVAMIAELDRIRALIAPRPSGAPGLTLQAFDQVCAGVLAVGGVLESRTDGTTILTVPLGRLEGAAFPERTANV